jgi:pimeloyl-ACP methyl ester carboxylesterase
LPALGICIEEYEYPYPVSFLPLRNDLRPVKMAYMDIPPATEPNGKTVVLIHGKAFGCYYFFRNVIEALTGSGYRVLAPDQIGWGRSPKPDIHYSFQLLAANTAALLDYLGVGNVAVLGHSTGGVTAVRFTLMNLDPVTHLVLEDPLGLADYRTGIPPQSEETLYQHELHWTDPARPLRPLACKGNADAQYRQISPREGACGSAPNRQRPERRSGHGQDDLETSSHRWLTMRLRSCRR